MNNRISRIETQDAIPIGIEKSNYDYDIDEPQLYMRLNFTQRESASLRWGKHKA